MYRHPAPRVPDEIPYVLPPRQRRWSEAAYVAGVCAFAPFAFVGVALWLIVYTAARIAWFLFRLVLACVLSIILIPIAHVTGERLHLEVSL
jgi:hypothetical protein